MMEPWVRLSLECVQPDFTELVTRAQPYCEVLRRVRIVSSETVPCSTRGPCQNVVILASPELVKCWEGAADGEIELAHMAEGYIFHQAISILEYEGLISRDD